MNFFKSQVQARRNTVQLVILFILAVCSLVVLVNLAVMAVFALQHGPERFSFNYMWSTMDWTTFGFVGLIVWVVVLIGSISKIIELSGGGKVIAQSIGGRLLMQNTTDPAEKRLLNVVQEMAIASSTPAPPVYLLEDEPGINAFAAGYSPRDAVIGVTRGLLTHLNREQLQGVIAHEFSHIFNGDMRLNIQLLGTVNGILVIGAIGYEMLRLPFRARLRGGSKNGGSIILLLLLLGFILFVLGYTGTLFGNMIKAAVSRQREFLADASAVQFTRNPQGITDALRTIGGLTIGSRILAHNAVEFSHAFFADGVPRFMQTMFATHPPLTERIRRIDPRWDGRFIKPTKADNTSATKRETDSVISVIAQEQVSAEPTNLEQALQQAGSPTPASVLQAQQLLAKIPDALRLEAAEPFGARAVIYALLLDKTFEIRVKQLELLQRKAEREVFQVLNRFMEELVKLEEHARLALIDLSMPALKQLSNHQYQLFRDNISALAEADGKLDLLEWSLGKILFNHLDRHFYNQPQAKRNIHSIERIQLEVELLISLLAISGHSDKSEADKAYKSSMNELGLPPGPMIEPKRMTGARLNQALLNAQQLTMQNQQTLLYACIHCVEYDQEVTAKEVEIVRAFCAAMDCPIPLFTRANQTGKRNSKQAPPRSPD